MEKLWNGKPFQAKKLNNHSKRNHIITKTRTIIDHIIKIRFNKIEIMTDLIDKDKNKQDQENNKEKNNNDDKRSELIIKIIY